MFQLFEARLMLKKKSVKIYSLGQKLKLIA